MIEKKRKKQEYILITSKRGFWLKIIFFNFFVTEPLKAVKISLKVLIFVITEVKKKILEKFFFHVSLLKAVKNN